MADVKISALPTATTPLAGTEVLPIVQSSTTKQVSIANVTAGRAISASSLTLTTPLSIADGGTSANLTAAAGGVIYSGASAMAISAVGSSGQIFQSNGAGAPNWTTATFPSTAASAGTILRADGTNWAATTATYPTTTTINQILYSSAANTIGGLATTNGGILNAGATGIPLMTVTPTLGVAGTSAGTIGLSGVTSGVITIQTAAAAGTWSLTLPTSGGTNGYALTTNGSGVSSWSVLTVAGGGTGLASGTSGGVPYFSASGTIASSAALAANSLVKGGGAGAAPATITTGTGVLTALGNTTNSASGICVLDASNRLAINVATTTYFLHVKGGNTNSVKVDNDGSQYTELDFANNGTNKASMWWDQTNTKFVFQAGAGAFELNANASYDIAFGSVSASARLTLDKNYNVVVGNAALATNATNGFLYIPTCAGTPTGTPTAFTGRAAIVYDTTNNKIYVYNGAWKATAALT